MATPDDCFHLTIEVVREIHQEVLSKFGGPKGVRDENLLASAVLTPQSSFGGKSPYTDLIDVAAAYLFYICRNHPFLDGNKRTGNDVSDRIFAPQRNRAGSRQRPLGKIDVGCGGK